MSCNRTLVNWAGAQPQCPKYMRCKEGLRHTGETGNVEKYNRTFMKSHLSFEKFHLVIHPAGEECEKFNERICHFRPTELDSRIQSNWLLPTDAAFPGLRSECSIHFSLSNLYFCLDRVSHRITSLESIFGGTLFLLRYPPTINACLSKSKQSGG